MVALYIHENPLSRDFHVNRIQRFGREFEQIERLGPYPGKAVAETVELAREMGSPVGKKPEEIYDNSFVNNLGKSVFLKELWGSENYKR